MAGTRLVQDLDVLRGRLARGKYPDHGRAHPRRLARLVGVRRRPRFRGRDARPRAALRAGQRLGQDDVSQAGCVGRRHGGFDPRRHEEIFRRHHALCAADVLGRTGEPDGAAARSGFDALCASRSTIRRCASRMASRSRCRHSGGRPRIPRRSTPRPAAFIRTTPARMFEAKSRGFDNCLVRDTIGNIAELANSNVFAAKDGVVFTPIAKRHVSRRHHPQARDRADARRRRERGRDRDALFRF